MAETRLHKEHVTLKIAVSGFKSWYLYVITRTPEANRILLQIYFSQKHTYLRVDGY